MIHLGDITKIDGKKIPFVNCITFGSPCQDLSVAGKRAGLAGERSGLFMVAVKAIKEMREASGGVNPTFVIWENVPGAFSSNGGEDFRAVLEELARIGEVGVAVPRPENGKWAKAGIICGDGWSVAWRTFDAQFWGVPQRRRRIAVVLDLGGQRAGEVLFERTGVSGNPEPSIPTWKGIARDPAHSAPRYDRVVGGKRAYGIGCYNSKGMLSDNPKAGFYETETSRTLDLNGGNPACNQGGIVIAIPIQEPGKRTGRSTREKTLPTVLCRAHGQANAETLEDLCPTLNCNHERPIVFENHSQDARYAQQGDTSPACTAQWGTGGNNMPLVAFPQNQRNEVRDLHNVAGALAAEPGMTQQAFVAEKGLRWIVRRLTPTECERLQGFPDGWTDICEFTDRHGVTHAMRGWLDDKGRWHKSADSPRYKALGNSIALPQWWWITCKMTAYLPERATLGSLFDGIGGFPLVWETRHGKGTALWASEIEPFPIAVTRERLE